MKIYKKIALLSAVALLGFTSCGDDFLDQVPDERVEVLSLDQVIQLLGSAYSASNYGWLCECSSDNIIDINAPFYATQSDGSRIRVH